VAAFIYYFLFLAALGVAIIGFFNVSNSQKARQYSSSEITRNATATKKEPRLFMVVPKTKHRSPAKKSANPAAPSTENGGAQKAGATKQVRASTAAIRALRGALTQR
jgi:hypothetical protein